MAKIYGLVYILFASLANCSQDWKCVPVSYKWDVEYEHGPKFFLILRKNPNGENQCATRGYGWVDLSDGFRCDTSHDTLQKCEKGLRNFKIIEKYDLKKLKSVASSRNLYYRNYHGILTCSKSKNSWILKPTYNPKLLNERNVRGYVKVSDFRDDKDWCEYQIAKPNVFDQCSNCEMARKCNLNTSAQGTEMECRNGFMSRNSSIVVDCCVTCCEIFSNNILFGDNSDTKQISSVDNLQKTVRVSYSVEVTYRATGYKKKSSEIRTYEKSSAFTKAYKSLSSDVSKALYNENSKSLSVSVTAIGYGSGTMRGSSNSVSASALNTAMSRVTDVSQKTENEEERYSKTEIEFQEGRFQVWRKVTQTLTIGQETLKLVEEDYQHDTNRDIRLNYYQNIATRYINNNYLPIGMKELKPGQTILRYGFMVTTSPSNQ